MRTALVDGDIFIYQAASANEYEAQWGPWLWTLHAHLGPAIAQFDDTLLTIQKDAQADKMVVALTHQQNFRKLVMPSYKHNRVKHRKPVIYQIMREYCEENYDTYLRASLEGDDILGILATHPKLVPGEKVIVSIDKDLKTIPGLHLRLDDPQRRLRLVSLEEADYWHMYQTLTGDSTDGYPGCPGIGPKRAEQMLSPFLIDEPGVNTFDRVGAWSAVMTAYAKAGFGEAVALQNARVARILRASDYDFKTKEVKLWLPPAP